MDFTIQTMRAPDSGEKIEAATQVHFDNTAELAFAVACVDAVRLFVELGSPDVEPSLAESVSATYKGVSSKLRSLMETGVDLAQALAPSGTPTESRFVSEDQVTANAVRLCVSSVTNNPEVRSYFPKDRSDLLTVFLPEA